MKTLLRILVVLSLFQAAAAADRTYHIDSVAGNDANTGLSPEQAWKSLEKAKGLTLHAGDKLSVEERLRLPGSACPRKRVRKLCRARCGR